MRFRGGEFSTGTMGNFQPELTYLRAPCRSALRFSAYNGLARGTVPGPVVFRIRRSWPENRLSVRRSLLNPNNCALSVLHNMKYWDTSPPQPREQGSETGDRSGEIGASRSERAARLNDTGV